MVHGRTSIVQGFAAVMERPLDASRFSNPVDIAGMARAFGLRSEVVTRPGEIDAAMLKRLASERRPVVRRGGGGGRWGGGGWRCGDVDR
jgi:thiamine pyrophosphate-dependent acetolactate synthase large subunit-like protein